MQASEIRQKFLDFFKSKAHQIVPSAPLVLKDDPTLMFTNAGMNQFKDYFLGNKTPASTRAADTQKCLRVTGKHNDLEDVGHDTYHHTMFEMLGNWSFGDYFKEKAIEWAWELLTEVYKLPKDKLYVTVFEGDKAQGLEPDEEAATFWKKWIAKDRIIYANKHDNFWEMGDVGPCGPCSEIHIDLRSEEERKEKDGKELVNQDHPQVVEIWNLVFIQFDRNWREKGLEKHNTFLKTHPKEQYKNEIEQSRIENTVLKSLPAQHIDTGMGFERLAMALQGKKSNYDTDVFQPMIQSIAKKANVEYGKDEKIDIALRVIADHIRAIAFAIADGQLPSNNKAGYVIRRILRRAVRYGYTFLKFREPFMHTLVTQLAAQFETVFPELKAQEAFIQKTVQEEENSFLRTLENGLKLWEDLKSKLTDKVVPGEKVFELYDTFGFPADLTALIAREEGFEVDEAGFEAEMQKQKERARAATSHEAGDWINLNEADGVEFLGYDVLEAQAKIVKYREVKTKKKTLYQIVLDQTPFYAESGGQIGDKGVLVLKGQESEERGVRSQESGNTTSPLTPHPSSLTIPIIDTKKENDLIIHFTPKDDFLKIENLAEATVEATVNESRRLLITNNHSATHLMHAALREVLGHHVEQRGSYVGDDLLRFDFSHPSKMTEEEITQVEKIVNQRIRENIALQERRQIPIQEALDAGATALFGEKYGDFVRMITFDEKFSRELCGGTHVPATGQIGFFKIISESSISAGVRRIEAITADKAEEFIGEQLTAIQQIKELLKAPKDVTKALQKVLDEKQALSKQIEVFENQQAQALKKELLEKVEAKNGVNFLAQKVSLPSADALKNMSFEIKNQVENLVMVLAVEIQGKPQVAVMIAENLVKEKDLNAGKIVKELAKEIKGGGGGQPFYATAGGKDLSGLDKVIEKAKDLV